MKNLFWVNWGRLRRRGKCYRSVSSRRQPLRQVIDRYTPREYLMYYGVQGFIIVIWFGSFPIPHPLLLSASCLSFSMFLCRRSIELTDGTGGGGEEEGAKSYDGEKAWSSLIHKLLSGHAVFFLCSAFHSSVFPPHSTWISADCQPKYSANCHMSHHLPPFLLILSTTSQIIEELKVHKHEIFMNFLT
jgi:hypothetical protein